MRKFIMEVCPRKPCKDSEFFDTALCWCVECNSCELLPFTDTDECDKACRDYLKSKHKESTITDTSIHPTTLSPVFDVTTKLGTPENQQPLEGILIAIVVAMLVAAVLVFFLCLGNRSNKKSSKRNEKEDLEEAGDSNQKSEYVTEENESERVTGKKDESKYVLKKMLNDTNKAKTGYTENEGREADLGGADQLNERMSDSNLVPGHGSNSNNDTEAVIEFTSDPDNSKTVGKSLKEEQEERLSACCGVNGTDSTRANHESSTPRSHLEQLKTSQHSPLMSEVYGTMTNMNIRQTDQEAFTMLDEVIETPQNEESAVLDDSLTHIKAIHGQQEEEAPLLEDTEQCGMEPVYSIKSVEEMPVRSNKSLYPILRGIPWVIGYFSQGNSIEVYIDFNEISPEEALNQLTRQTGTSPKKYHVKENEFYP